MFSENQKMVRKVSLFHEALMMNQNRIIPCNRKPLNGDDIIYDDFKIQQKYGRKHDQIKVFKKMKIATRVKRFKWNDEIHFGYDSKPKILQRSKRVQNYKRRESKKRQTCSRKLDYDLKNQFNIEHDDNINDDKSDDSDDYDSDDYDSDDDIILNEDPFNNLFKGILSEEVLTKFNMISSDILKCGNDVKKLEVLYQEHMDLLFEHLKLDLILDENIF